MIFTLSWKELREHQGIWITMVFLSVLLGIGLAKIVALGDATLGVAVAAFTILGLAATYGVVCGSMMLAGEHEGGTLPFLDIFSGRRGLLWTGKFVIGIVLALTQALAVAFLLRLLQQEAPSWIRAIVGQTVPIGAVRGVEDADAWLMILPVVTVEAFFWGMLGSSLAQRVLVGAAVAAAIFTPLMLLAITAPPEVIVVVRTLAAIGCLVISFSNFVGRSRENAPPPMMQPRPEFAVDEKERFLEQWERFEYGGERLSESAAPRARLSVPETNPDWDGDRSDIDRRPSTFESVFGEPDQAKSPTEVLWWLTWQQGWPIFWSLTVAALLIGLIIVPANFQVFWPLATLMLGIACGTAAFAPEQRDLSYQFLAAQHFPLKLIWRFRILFWLAIAVLETLILFLASVLIVVFIAARRPAAGQVELFGEFSHIMGPTLFFSVWLVYGFCSGQVIVWLCRKNILALLVSSLVAFAAVSLWLPSLVCGGMTGWQVYVPPLIFLLTTWTLVRAWAGGRLWERKPMAGLFGFAAAIVVWAGLVYGYRAWEIPNVGAPLDPLAFRDSLPSQKDNAAAKAIQKAVAEYGERNHLWMPPLAELVHLPVGVIYLPGADGQPPVVNHLPTCRKMSEDLLQRAQRADQAQAFEYLAPILALSRNLRSKAALESYLVGIELEIDALTELDQWLQRGKPGPKLLRHVLDEMNRHAEETPPPLDCVQTMCYRSGGMLGNPNAWSFMAGDGRGRVSQHWLANSIALSLDMPWEAERKARIWQLVWAGHFRAIQTPHWQLPTSQTSLRAAKPETHSILRDWLPAVDGRGATRQDAADWLDRSWLADERLFTSVGRLRSAATRAQWHVDATRQALALGLYQMDEGKAARDLQDLVPKYIPAKLPIDPYSGEIFRYGIAPRARLWSTGPDRIDHGGLKHGGDHSDDDPHWASEGLDLILDVPNWP